MKKLGHRLIELPKREQDFLKSRAGPDDLRAHREPGRFDSRLKFPLGRRRVANVQSGGWLDCGPVGREHGQEERLKFGRRQRIALDFELFLGISLVYPS